MQIYFRILNTMNQRVTAVTGDNVLQGNIRWRVPWIETNKTTERQPSGDTKRTNRGTDHRSTAEYHEQIN